MTCVPAVRIGPAATVADVGCGPGAVSALVGGLVGPDGHIGAVDQDRRALATAEQLAARLGSTNVHCHVGRADNTGLPSAAADVAMMRHVLVHNGAASKRSSITWPRSYAPAASWSSRQLDASRGVQDSRFPGHPDAPLCRRTGALLSGSWRVGLWDG